MLGTFYLPLVLLAGTVGMAVAGYTWLHRDQPGALPLTVLVMAASVWAVVEGLTVADAAVDSMVFWSMVALSLSVVLPLAWLVTVLEFTGRDSWLGTRLLALLLVEPILFLALVWTNDTHALVWRDAVPVSVGEFSALTLEFGIVFWGHQAYSMALVAVGALLLFASMLGSNEYYRWQSTAILAAVLVPIVGNALHVYGHLPSGLDPTAIGFVCTGMVVAGVMFETELASIAPLTRQVGRDAALTELEDAIIILDDGGRIVDLNPAAEALVGAEATACLGHHLTETVPDLDGVLDEASNRAHLELERQGKRRHFDVRTSSLSLGFGALSGRVISLRDVTAQRQRQQRLDVLNRLLRHNIRNELNVVRGKIELENVDRETESVRLEAALEKIDGIVERSNKVGRLSRLLEGETGGRIDLGRELRGQFDETTITLDLPASLPVNGGRSLVVGFEELVDNAIEHNDAEDPQVSIRLDEAASDENTVVLAVSDNGPGIGEYEWQTLSAGRETPLQHGSGVGLWLVHWVVRRAGGTLDLETTADGSVVWVRLPRATEVFEVDGPGTDGHEVDGSSEKVGNESTDGQDPVGDPEPPAE